MTDIPPPPDPLPSSEPTAIPPAEPPLNPPPIFDPALFPSRRRPALQFLLDHNPCLLLSTVLMLLGCYLVNSALKESTDNAKLLALLGVINIYEACIIPLGLVLIRRTRGTARDGLWLLMFEVLFLINATYINVDFGPAWGWSFNLLLFFLACAKAAVLFHGLKLGLRLRTLGFFILQLAIVYGLPILFSFIKTDGVASQSSMYLLWWLVGLLPLVYELLARLDRTPPRYDLVQTVMRRTYLIAPWIMLVMELRFSHWAHHSEFQWADLAPVCLGIAIASRRLKLPQTPRTLTGFFPVLACILAFQDAPELRWSFTFGDSLHTLTPIHFTCVATIPAFLYLVSDFHGLCAAAASALATFGYIFDGWILWFFRGMRAFLHDVFTVLLDWLPRTPLAWGITAILAAFLTLAMGSFIALRKAARKT